jgi:hypothetical protein
MNESKASGADSPSEEERREEELSIYIARSVTRQHSSALEIGFARPSIEPGRFRTNNRLRPRTGLWSGTPGAGQECRRGRNSFHLSLG